MAFLLLFFTEYMRWSAFCTMASVVSGGSSKVMAPMLKVTGQCFPLHQRLQLAMQFGKDLPGCVFLGFREEQRELVSPHAGQQIRASQVAADGLGHRRQQRVAGRVPPRIVHCLEAINVQVRYRQGVAVPAGTDPFLIGQAVERA